MSAICSVRRLIHLTMMLRCTTVIGRRLALLYKEHDIRAKGWKTCPVEPELADHGKIGPEHILGYHFQLLNEKTGWMVEKLQFPWFTIGFYPRNSSLVNGVRSDSIRATPSLFGLHFRLTQSCRLSRAARPGGPRLFGGEMLDVIH